MTNAQLYVAVALPVLAVLIGIFVNSSQINVLNSRLSAVGARLQRLEDKIDTKFDLLLGKLFELDNRLNRLEERLKH